MFGLLMSVQFKLVLEKYGNEYGGIPKDKSNGYQIILQLVQRIKIQL